MPRVFSGVQPTGNLHLGNYLGAIRNFVSLQDEHETIYCVVDLHAITVQQDPAALREQILEVAATFIAAGIDPERSIIFNQSRVVQHAELAWIFNCVARLGWLNRMTQFKEKAGKHRENASAGLYVYPCLMAADILAYRADRVPVGDDQRQHLELARDIAQKFNHDYGREFFPIIEPLIQGQATRVMSLRDGRAKMSKSDPSDQSRIGLTDDADTIARKIRRARTDPERLPDEAALADDGGLSPDLVDSRPEAANLLTIFAALARKPIGDVVASYAGAEFSRFKTDLADLAVASLAPLAERTRSLLDERAELEAILDSGAERATAIAQPVVNEVKRIVGFF